MEKIAIKVSNECEFKALMEHYEGKGFRCPVHFGKIEYSDVYQYVPYHNDYIRHSDQSAELKRDYTIIPFPIFATIAGIEFRVEEVVIELSNGDLATVNKDGVRFNFERTTGMRITQHEFDEIYTAYKSLGE